MWGLEWIGVLSPTVICIDGALLLKSPLDGIEHFPVEAALCSFMVFGVATSGALAFVTSKFVRIARQRTHFQAWQVRQLISRN
jgi:hypothetical protein